MSTRFDEDFRPAVNPLDEHTDLLERITGHLADIKQSGAPLTETDVGAMKSALDTIAFHAPAIAGALGSIKIAAWIIAATTVLHLLLH